MKVYYLAKDGSFNHYKEIPDDGIFQKQEFQQLVALFKHSSIQLIEGNTFKLSKLIALAQKFNTEFAACTKNGKLYIVKGNDSDLDNGVAGSVMVPHGYDIKVHVHPTFESYSEHFSVDLRNCGNQLEAVVDYNHTVIVYDKNSHIYNHKEINDRTKEGLLFLSIIKIPIGPHFFRKA